MTRNSEALDSFVDYCRAHPSERFWQALRNWSRFAFILGRERGRDYDVDTYNLEGLDGTRPEYAGKPSAPVERLWRVQAVGTQSFALGSQYEEAECDALMRANPGIFRKQYRVPAGPWVDDDGR